MTLRDLNGEDTLFTSLLSAPGTHQLKVVYGKGLGTASIGQTLTISNNLLTLYGDGGPDIDPSHILVLYATVRDKVLVKNLTTGYVQTGFTNRNAVGHHIKRASNVTKEE